MEELIAKNSLLWGKPYQGTLYIDIPTVHIMKNYYELFQKLMQCKQSSRDFLFMEQLNSNYQHIIICACSDPSHKMQLSNQELYSALNGPKDRA